MSTLNSVATVSWEDFCTHIPSFRKFSDSKQLYAIKVLGVTYALICMGLAYVVSMFSGVIEISMFINASTSGTLVGVFFLAMLVPFANGKGASVGIIVAHLTIIALSTASYLSDGMMKTKFLPTSIEVSRSEIIKRYIWFAPLNYDICNRFCFWFICRDATSQSNITISCTSQYLAITIEWAASI